MIKMQCNNERAIPLIGVFLRVKEIPIGPIVQTPLLIWSRVFAGFHLMFLSWVWRRSEETE